MTQFAVRNEDVRSCSYIGVKKITTGPNGYMTPQALQNRRVIARCMARTPKPPPTIKAALTRLVVAAVVWASLTVSCFQTADPDLRVLVGVLAVAAFLVALMFGMDAGKAINRGPPKSRSLRALGAVLIFPLAVFGATFIGTGLLLLFVSVRTLEMAACSGHLAAMAAEQLMVGLMMPLGGYGMLREGLRQDPRVVKVVQLGSREVTVVSVPLWLRVSMFADGIAIGTSFLAFAAVAASSSCEAAAWIWSPTVSVSIAIAAIGLAWRVFALRRRRMAQNAN